MYCPECGNQNPDTAKFCMKCGYNYRHTSAAENSSEYQSVSSPRPTASTPLPSAPRNSKRANNKNSSVGVFTVLVLLIGGGILVFMYVANLDRSNMKLSTAQNFSSTMPQPEIRQEQSVDIVNQSFSLSAGQFASYKFSIPKEAGGGRVSGTFTASGGSNDIYALITNESGITNLKDGNQTKGYYNSGKVTTDDLKVNLSPGTYYIVFSNLHSMMTPKAVSIDVKMEELD